MSVTEVVATAYSIILGLAVTVMLTAALDAFRHRATTRLHWVPFVWMLIVLSTFFQSWWSFGVGTSIIGEGFTRGEFLLVLLFPMGCFASGSLVLPSRASPEHASLLDYFLAEGKWGAAAYAATMVIVSVINIHFYGMSPDPRAEGMVLPNVVFLMLPLSLVFVCMAVVMSRSRRSVQVLTLIAAALQATIMTVLGMAPAS